MTANYVEREIEMDEESVEDGLGDEVEFGLVLDEDDKALMLVRTDFEEGGMYYRSQKSWVLITPDDDIPLLDQFPLTRVSGDATEIWDLHGDRTKTEFDEVLLDDVD
jgi:hypothetical protein